MWCLEVMSWEHYPLKENQWKQPISLSAVSLYNTSKNSSPSWDCQEDVNLLLFMWERGKSKTQTRERLEINSTCVCVCMCAWMWAASFLSLQIFSVACQQGCVYHFNASLQQQPIVLCCSIRCMYKNMFINPHYPLFLFPWFNTAATTEVVEKKNYELRD